MTTEPALVALARDLSNGDSEIAELARQFVDQPPTSLEEIGFYGAAGEAPEVRAFYGVVTALSNAEHLYSVEDKYTPEIVCQWIDEGIIPLDALPPTARSSFALIASEDEPDREEDLEFLRERLVRGYAEAARELESYLATVGKALLSIDATAGDTMFFALVDTAVADRWRNKAFAVAGDGYRAGVRPVMWDRFWIHLCYALSFFDLDDLDDPYPPGTRLRDDTIPMVED